MSRGNNNFESIQPYGQRLQFNALSWQEYVDLKPGTVVRLHRDNTVSYVFVSLEDQPAGKIAVGALDVVSESNEITSYKDVILDLRHPIPFLGQAQVPSVSFTFTDQAGNRMRILPGTTTAEAAFDDALAEQIYLDKQQAAALSPFQSLEAQKVLHALLDSTFMQDGGITRQSIEHILQHVEPRQAVDNKERGK